MEDRTTKTKTDGLSIFLVDDDPDDRELFTEAIAEVDRNIALSTFSDGMSLMGHALYAGIRTGTFGNGP